MELKPYLREGFFPLPITFISTISKSGVRNIAPYSCVMPVLRPTDLVCVATAVRRDTLANIRETGEFVINMAGEQMVNAVIPTARFSSPETDEFKLAGLEEKPSQKISAPGIAGCYCWMECILDKIFEEKNYLLIMGKVVRLEADEDLLNNDNSLNIERARPLVMTGNHQGMFYSTLKDTGKHDPFSAMFESGTDPVSENKNPVT